MDDESKPKRRSAVRHALGGLALLVCIGLGMWLLESRGWTNWYGSWRRFQIEVWDHGSIRNQVKVGMTRDEVRMRIGRGQDVALRYSVAAERYHQHGFQVIFFEKQTNNGLEWFVEQVEDWPGANSWRRPDEPPATRAP